MKKQTKKQTGPAAVTAACSVCRSHKFRAVIALLGLFVCGVAVGLAWRDGMQYDAKNSGESSTVMIATAASVENQNPACQVIEDVLGQYVFSNGDSVEKFARNAKIYTLMSEQGCPENAEKFKAMAQRELEIAIVLSEYLYVKDSAAADVIRAYKKLNMQREAQEFVNKLQKLTDPAIDFIMKMESVINE